MKFRAWHLVSSFARNIASPSLIDANVRTPTLKVKRVGSTSETQAPPAIKNKKTKLDPPDSSWHDQVCYVFMSFFSKLSIVDLRTATRLSAIFDQRFHFNCASCFVHAPAPDFYHESGLYTIHLACKIHNSLTWLLNSASWLYACWL